MENESKARLDDISPNIEAIKFKGQEAQPARTAAEDEIIALLKAQVRYATLTYMAVRMMLNDGDRDAMDLFHARMETESDGQ